MMGRHGDAGTGFLTCLAIGVLLLFVFALTVWLVLRLLPNSATPATSTAGTGATTGSRQPAGESLLGILDRRLATGEIDLETWQANRAAILSARRDDRSARHDDRSARHDEA